jgi:hypothetical protein
MSSADDEDEVQSSTIEGPIADAESDQPDEAEDAAGAPPPGPPG